jgi:hypothetical protein
MGMKEKENKIPRQQGRFIKGFRYNKATEFKKGEHWRKHKPYWDKEWLEREYLTNKRSAASIARTFGVSCKVIYYFLDKNNICRRSASEARMLSGHCLSGADNPMYGVRGKRHPRWRGGTSPERQGFYESEEWKSACCFVWRRDQATCQKCHKKHKPKTRAFHVHHIIPFEFKKYRAAPFNLMLLCERCHRLVHTKQNRWGIYRCPKKLYQ